jgi:N-acetylglucosamine-6-phosphate deacetylase
MAAMGLPVSSHCHIGEQQVEVREEEGGKRRRAVVRGTDVLAGSVATMDQCVREMMRATGCGLVEAVEAGSLHAADVLGETGKGRLDVGCDADLILIDDEMHVLGVWIGGQQAWVKEDVVTMKGV